MSVHQTVDVAGLVDDEITACSQHELLPTMEGSATSPLPLISVSEEAQPMTSRTYRRRAHSYVPPPAPSPPSHLRHATASLRTRKSDSNHLPGSNLHQDKRSSAPDTAPEANAGSYGVKTLLKARHPFTTPEFDFASLCRQIGATQRQMKILQAEICNLRQDLSMLAKGSYAGNSFSSNSFQDGSETTGESEEERLNRFLR